MLEHRNDVRLLKTEIENAAITLSDSNISLAPRLFFRSQDKFDNVLVVVTMFCGGLRTLAEGAIRCQKWPFDKLCPN